MATRVYMTSRACGTNLLGAPYGDWSAGDSTRDNRGQHWWTMLADASATNGGVITSTSAGASITKANLQPIMLANGMRWATRRLASDTTLSGTITICHKTENPSAAALAAVSGRLYAYVSTGDTVTQRVVLIANLNDATAWTATATYRTMTYAITGSVQALAGDRLIFEIGARCSPPTAPAGDNSFVAKWGTTNSSEVTQADAANGDTADRAAWIEMSTTFSFAAAASPPANDACADATVITSPYTSAAIDTTASADTERGVWFSFTPAETGRYILTTHGGNYQSRIRLNTGTCGGLVLAQQESIAAWQGTSQTTLVWDATGGTAYLINVRNARVTAGPQAALTALESGGSLVLNLRPYALPADGDLFVNCQHIVCFRDGVMVNVQSGFYNDTPTNSAIDYSEQSLDDLNGGTNSSRRLYVDLFGANPIVEILDLDTLNVGQFEVDYIDAALNGAGNSENLSSIVMDAHVVGSEPNIITGYFGDNYSVQGQLSTAQQCRPNRMPAKNADNQTGAPWPVATAFTVAQENEGSDYLDLSTNLSTVFYTSAGVLVKRYDLDSSTQGSNFATLPAQSVSALTPRPGARGVRLLSPYDGSGGALVAYGNCVHKLDASGSVIGTYIPSLPTLAKDLDKVELTPDGASAWVSDQYSTYMFRFTVDTMVEEFNFATLLPPGQLCGFTVLGYRGTPVSSYSIETEVRPIRRLRQSPHIGANGKRLMHRMFQLDLQVGVGLISGQGENPQVMFQTSRDGGMTWSDERFASAGVMGRYLQRVMFWRNGIARDMVYRIVVSDPVAWRLVAAYLEIEEAFN